MWQLVAIAAASCLVLSCAGSDASQGELVGSRPPQGVQRPAVESIAGVTPPVKAAAVEGVTAIAVSCGTCPSGQILARSLEAGRRDLTGKLADVHVTVIVTGSADEAGLSSAGPLTVHAARGRAADKVRDAFKVGAGTSTLFLYDSRGIWRSTFHAAQMEPEDILHDARTLVEEDDG